MKLMKCWFVHSNSRHRIVYIVVDEIRYMYKRQTPRGKLLTAVMMSTQRPAAVNVFAPDYVPNPRYLAFFYRPLLLLAGLCIITAPLPLRAPSRRRRGHRARPLSISLYPRRWRRSRTVVATLRNLGARQSRDRKRVPTHLLPLYIPNPIDPAKSPQERLLSMIRIPLP